MTTLDDWAGLASTWAQRDAGAFVRVASEQEDWRGWARQRFVDHVRRFAPAIQIGQPPWVDWWVHPAAAPDRQLAIALRCSSPSRRSWFAEGLLADLARLEPHRLPAEHRGCTTAVLGITLDGDGLDFMANRGFQLIFQDHRVGVAYRTPATTAGTSAGPS